MSSRPVSLFGLDSDLGPAVFSPCRDYRYALQRRWGGGPFVLFLGLNPSKADEVEDDMTIRKCMGFAKRWGMGGILMGNLFSYCATKPSDLALADDPIGPDTDVWLTTMSVRSAITIAAWGSQPMAAARVPDVLWLFDKLYSLGVTKDGSPRHPSRVAYKTPLSRWRP